MPSDRDVIGNDRSSDRPVIRPLNPRGQLTPRGIGVNIPIESLDATCQGDSTIEGEPTNYRANSPFVKFRLLNKDHIDGVNLTELNAIALIQQILLPVTQDGRLRILDYVQNLTDNTRI